MAKQFLKTHYHVFASRPQTAASKCITYNYLNITWVPYGPYWRQGRKIYLSKLCSSKKLESYEYIRVEELRAFASRLYSLSGKPVLLNEHLSRVTLSIMAESCWGRRYLKRMKALKKKLDRFHNHVFEEHKAKLKGLMEDFVPKDMVDWLFQLTDDPNLEVKLNYDSVNGLRQLSNIPFYFVFAFLKEMIEILSRAENRSADFFNW
ncbi:hypothetical protein Ddye_020409 [Dipteronia dyeriana]|uniref:Cytochrome P450 n=1 Tax=Dipteronia dyeriana TaxID=168575 RepID=A0AAD9U0M4_9ROSI|nr:hypothetical protein Ddye_020409 [Dipteronia dyeriana]